MSEEKTIRDKFVEEQMRICVIFERIKITIVVKNDDIYLNLNDQE